MEVLEKEIRSKEEIIREIKGYRRDIDTIDMRLDKLHKELAEVEELEKKNKVWKPALKEKYWYIIDDGTVNRSEWGNYKIDNWNYSIGNCFKTEEQAERRKFELELEGKARLFQLENNEEIDWEDDNKEKFHIYYPLKTKVIRTDWLYSIKSANKLGYFSCMKLARQFINENKEDLIKYFEGMK